MIYFLWTYVLSFLTIQRPREKYRWLILRHFIYTIILIMSKHCEVKDIYSMVKDTYTMVIYYIICLIKLFIYFLTMKSFSICWFLPSFKRFRWSLHLWTDQVIVTAWHIANTCLYPYRYIIQLCIDKYIIYFIIYKHL